VVELLYSYLASAGISSSESLLSALKTADTGLGRDTGGMVVVWGREVFSDILIPKPLLGGFKRGVGLMGESGGLGEGEGLIVGMVGAGREGVCGGGCRREGTGGSPADITSPRGGGTPDGVRPNRGARPSGGGGANPRGGGGANPRGGGGANPRGGGTGPIALLSGGGGRLGLVPGGGGGGACPLPLSSWLPDF